jgi:dCMP deaminase
MMDDYVVTGLVTLPFDKWDLRYMEMARLVSTWSKDPSSKIGAVAVGKHGQILSTGYNGFPRGIKDTTARLEDRETKYRYIVHAEMNIVYNASLTDVSLEGSTVYVWGLPVCSECAKGLIQSGVARVVIDRTFVAKDPKWKKSWADSIEMFREAGVRVSEIALGGAGDGVHSDEELEGGPGVHDQGGSREPRQEPPGQVEHG